MKSPAPPWTARWAAIVLIMAFACRGVFKNDTFLGALFRGCNRSNGADAETEAIIVIKAHHTLMPTAMVKHLLMDWQAVEKLIADNE